MWWIRDPGCLKREAEFIEALREGESWLGPTNTRLIDNLRLAVDFDVLINGDWLPFTLQYPTFFPETPPSVIPRDGRQVSGHQYGDGGELCLEYRSDNWDPSVTGAMMIESAHRLLAGEQPSPGERAVVPSAHYSSLGQQLRGSNCRFLLTSGFHAYAAALGIGEWRHCAVAEIFGPKKTWVAYVTSVGAPTPDWRETTIPTRDNGGVAGTILRLASLEEARVTDKASLDRLLAQARQAGALPANDNALGNFTVIADSHSARMYFSFHKDGQWHVIPYRTIDLTKEVGMRLPESYAALSGKKVGLVGCGSLGTKIASSLARSGVCSFVLVDDDVMKPGNLVRNDLDASSLGVHKVDALEARLKALGSDITVSARSVSLGGQESSGSTASVLEELAKCDLLVDATADPQAFNFVASVARAALRPMLWAEVYAGGIGGFIARLRPNIEPPPHTARRQYLAWCREQNVPWHGEGHDYDARQDEAPPLVADDGDVAVIAAHAARMALDTLVRGEASAFPHPAYVVGLATEWRFDGPFDTYPIDFLPQDEWRPPATETQVTEAVDYVVSMLTKGADEDRTGT